MVLREFEVMMMMMDSQVPVVRAATPNWVHARVFRPPKHKQGPTSWAYRAEIHGMVWYGMVW